MSAAITMPLPARRVAVYCRVSSDRQNEENQVPDIERWLAAHHQEADVRWFRERASATKQKGRPIFEQVLAEAKAGRVDTLIVWRLDRFGRSLGRNVQDFLALDSAGVRVESVTESWLNVEGPIRALLVSIFSWVAEQEIATLKQRTVAGIKRVTAAGGAVGGVRYGLRTERGADGVPRKVLDEAAVPTLHAMAALFAAGDSLRGAALKLNARPEAEQHGGPFGHAHLRRILTDRDLRALGAWPADVVAAVDARLGELPRAEPRGAWAPAHLAASFVRCAVCGGSVTVKNERYVCARRAAKGPSACRGIGSRLKTEVDRALLDVVGSAVRGPVAERALAIARTMLDEAPDAATERQAVASALERAESDGKAIATAIRKRGPLDLLLDEAEAIDERTKALRDRLARLDAAPPSLDRRRRLAAVERLLGDLAGVLDRGGIAARPAVEAVLAGSRLSAIPVRVDGEHRWELTGSLSGGYLLGMTGGLPSLPTGGSSGNGGPEGSVTDPALPEVRIELRSVA